MRDSCEASVLLFTSERCRSNSLFLLVSRRIQLLLLLKEKSGSSQWMQSSLCTQKRVMDTFIAHPFVLVLSECLLFCPWMSYLTALSLSASAGTGWRTTSTSNVRPPASSCTQWPLASARRSTFTAFGPFRSTRKANRLNTTTTTPSNMSTPPARVLTPCLWSSGPWARCTDRGRYGSTLGFVASSRDHRKISRANSRRFCGKQTWIRAVFLVASTFMRLELTYFQQLEWTIFLFQAQRVTNSTLRPEVSPQAHLFLRVCMCVE